MTHCVVGGTFTYVHKGHMGLFEECRKFDSITLGLTSDKFVKEHKIYPSFPYEKRLSGVKEALGRLGIAGKTEIVKIDDELGGAHEMENADAIVVSEETLPIAGKINMLRSKKGRKALEIIAVPLCFGDDLKKISCSSIFDGKAGLDGTLLKPLAIQAGTENPAKLRGAKAALARIFGGKFEVVAHTEKSKVPDHPFNHQTFHGARNRAVASWRRAGGKCDYSIGIESGLFTLHKMHIDITIACVYDGREETYGTGMGFVVMEEIAQMIKKEKTDLTQVMEKIAGIEDIGRKEGAIGYFSAGVLARHEQIEQAVACAFVPRLHAARVGGK